MVFFVHPPLSGSVISEALCQLPPSKVNGEASRSEVLPAPTQRQISWQQNPMGKQRLVALEQLNSGWQQGKDKRVTWMPDAELGLTRGRWKLVGEPSFSLETIRSIRAYTLQSIRTDAVSLQPTTVYNCLCPLTSESSKQFQGSAKELRFLMYPASFPQATSSEKPAGNWKSLLLSLLFLFFLFLYLVREYI